MGAHRANVALAIVLAGLPALAAANDVSRLKASEAMATCEGVDRLPAAKKKEKLEQLEAAVVVAEAAIAADERDARAHLALVCAVGKQLDIAGLSWRVFGQVRRVQAEIDRAHELAPDDPDVLVAKGQILRRTPGPLGGNKDAGTKLLRRAVELAPDHVPARLYLAAAMADDGEPDARRSLYEALALAKKRGAVREQTEAQHLLAALDD